MDGGGGGPIHHGDALGRISQEMQNNNDRIPNQIELIGTRNLAGCAATVLALLVIGCLALRLTMRATHDSGTRLAAALVMSGVVFGFATSALTPQARKFLTRVFVLLPLVVTLILFAYRTMFGQVELLPLRLTLAPLAMAVGFLVGRVGRTSP